MIAIVLKLAPSKPAGQDAAIAAVTSQYIFATIPSLLLLVFSECARRYLMAQSVVTPMAVSYHSQNCHALLLLLRQIEYFPATTTEPTAQKIPQPTKHRTCQQPPSPEIISLTRTVRCEDPPL